MSKTFSYLIYVLIHRKKVIYFCLYFFFQNYVYIENSGIGIGIGIDWPPISGIGIGIAWLKISSIGIGWTQISSISIGIDWNFGIGTSLK